MKTTNTKLLGRALALYGLLAGLAAGQGSAQSFNLDTLPSGLTVTVDGTNYTTPVAFAWEAGSSHSLDTPTPQLAMDGHSRSVFGEWSDGAAQSHTIVMPAYDTNCVATFATQYLLDVTVAPTGAGSVSNYPSGPWYNTGQSVSLFARTNNGYRIYYWQGADTASSNTAQVTMSAYHSLQAAFIPADYPYVLVTNGGGTAPGSWIGNFGGRSADSTKTYYVVLDNTGTNLLYASSTNTILRFVTPQGFATATGTGGFRFKDESLTNVVDTSTTLGYTLDTHDVKLLPNGHSFLFGSEVRTFDMSGVVTGGKTAASVTGDIIQEIDANNRLVFEWHTFDYIAITNTFADMTQSSFDYAHVNAMSIDPTDNNLLASLRTTSEIVKIDRRTGQVIWRLGGKRNMFTFLGEHPENAPYYTVGQHDIHRLPNGHLLFFDNGNISGGGVTPNDRPYSRAVEYALDEINMTATLVWEFRHMPDISAPCTGAVKRFANGNTLIDWGCAVPTSGTIVTEVDPSGHIVFEMNHRVNNGVSSVLLGGGLTKQVWNSPDLKRCVGLQGVQLGQTYSADAAGAVVTINGLSAPADNSLVVERHLDAVRLPQFAGKAPQVVMEHLVLSSSNITALSAQLDLALPDTSSSFDTPVIHDPSQVTVYQRPVPGQGPFTALTTTYNPATQKLSAAAAPLGEFVFAYPDVSETPFAPATLSPANQSQVNQAAPVTMAWVPQGLVGSFDLQIATDSGFANLLVDTNGLGSPNFTLQAPPANAQVFWRVRTVNQGGTSAWASACFFTVPPYIHINAPAGGEVWQRFQVVTFRWVANVSENLAIDLYLAGVSNRTLTASTPNSGSYTWTVGQFSALPYGTNYTLKLRSTVTPSLFDISQPFAIVTNSLVTIATAPAGLTLIVDGTNYTAPAVFSWLPTSSHTLDTPSPQVAADGHSRSNFLAWSDGGYRAHSLTVPFASLTNTAWFTTNYLLDVATTPAGGGSVTANPAGPWYDLAQPVSLAATPNDGYLFYSWQGVDSQANTAAQLMMTGYRSVQARFLPVSAVPLIDTTSFVRLANGQVQFSFSAGAGVVTQATVWATSSLQPAAWQSLGTVPLSNGGGTFIETPPPTATNRFYRVTLP